MYIARIVDLISFCVTQSTTRKHYISKAQSSNYLILEPIKILHHVTKEKNNIQNANTGI